MKNIKNKKYVFLVLSIFFIEKFFLFELLLVIEFSIGVFFNSWVLIIINIIVIIF